jgi:hypothetical protein
MIWNSFLNKNLETRPNKKNLPYCRSATWKKAGSNMRTWHGIQRIGSVQMVSHRPFCYKPGLGGTQVYRRKRVLKEKEVD